MTGTCKKPRESLCNTIFADRRMPITKPKDDMLQSGSYFVSVDAAAATSTVNVLSNVGIKCSMPETPSSRT